MKKNEVLTICFMAFLLIAAQLALLTEISATRSAIDKYDESVRATKIPLQEDIDWLKIRVDALEKKANSAAEKSGVRGKTDAAVLGSKARLLLENNKLKIKSYKTVANKESVSFEFAVEGSMASFIHFLHDVDAMKPELQISTLNFAKNQAGDINSTFRIGHE